MILCRKFCFDISVFIYIWVSTLFAGFKTAGEELPNTNLSSIDNIAEEWNELDNLTSKISKEAIQYLNTSFTDDDNSSESNLESARNKLNEAELYEDVTDKGNISQRSFIILPGSAKHKLPFVSFHRRSKNKGSDFWDRPAGHKTVTHGTQVHVATTIRYHKQSSAAKSNKGKWKNNNAMDNLTKQVVDRLINQHHPREKNKIGFSMLSSAPRRYNVDSRKYKNNHTGTKKLFYVSKNQVPPAQFGFTGCNKQNSWYPSHRVDDKRTMINKGINDPQNKLVKDLFPKVTKSNVTLLTKVQNRTKQFYPYGTTKPPGHNYHFSRKSNAFQSQTDVLDPNTGNLNPKVDAFVNMHHAQPTPLDYIPRRINRLKVDHYNRNTLNTVPNINQGVAYPSGTIRKHKKQISGENDFVETDILQKLEEIHSILKNESESNANDDLDVTVKSLESASDTNHSTSTSISNCIHPDCVTIANENKNKAI